MYLYIYIDIDLYRYIYIYLLEFIHFSTIYVPDTRTRHGIKIFRDLIIHLYS